ncbi:hypothetical protein RRG08_054883 [Elysia crispata]|uniref:Uncharacterized protein n=1 Tax=Elysia crispata TaxID=231223 RepID=A0AAE1DSQ8_9GAST|nr:hypothetical protein RRG08_054883 [Elysia crispata]
MFLRFHQLIFRSNSSWEGDVQQEVIQAPNSGLFNAFLLFRPCFKPTTHDLHGCAIIRCADFYTQVWGLTFDPCREVNPGRTSRTVNKQGAHCVKLRGKINAPSGSSVCYAIPQGKGTLY